MLKAPVSAAVMLVITLIPLWRNQHWLVRGMDFPRLQFAVASAVILAGQAKFLYAGEVTSVAPFLLTLFCLVWQLWWIIPYTPFWPREVKDSRSTGARRRLRIITANVLASNHNADALLSLVRRRKPDILVTLESDLWWEKKLDSLERFLPHTMKCPLDNLYGMHVYSRLPLEETEIRFLVEEDVPSMHALLRLRTGDGIRMHFLHPAPPSPTENPDSSERDAELVIVGRSVAGSSLPVIVTGDLNDVAWSATTRLFRKISGLLDPRVGRGMFNTYHAGIFFMRWPLDHIFHSKHFTVRSIGRLPSIGSDHFALLTELALTPADGADQHGLEPEVDDEDWADEITAAENVSEDDVPEPGE